MTSLIDRRRMLFLMGGLGVGVAASPMPWKLLDDVAIWTQNAPWASSLPKGPVEERYSHCPICPAGCGVRIKTVASIPFAIGPVPGHPMSEGKVCPLGLCGHHLLVTPGNLRSARIRDLDDGRSRDIPQALGIQMLADWMTETERAGGTLALLDSRPDSSKTRFYDGVLSTVNGSRHIQLAGERAPLIALEALTNRPVGRPWVDLSGREQLLCFGGAVEDGWGSAAAPQRAWMTRGPKTATLIHSRDLPRTPSSYSTMRVAPGSEAVLAMGLARQVWDSDNTDRGHLEATIRDLHGGPAGGFVDVLQAFDSSTAASICGVSKTDIEHLGSRLASEPTLVLALSHLACDQSNPISHVAIMGLNILLGNVGGAGPIKFSPPRDDAGQSRGPGEATFADLEDGSVDLMIVDDQTGASIPDPTALARKLRDPEKSRVVRLSAYERSTDPSWDLLLAMPGHWEEPVEISSPADHPGECLGLSMPLTSSPTVGARGNPVEIAVRLRSLRDGRRPERHPGPEEFFRRRVRDILDSVRGSVFIPGSAAPEIVETRSLSSVDDLMSTLRRGGLWFDRGTDIPADPEFHLLGDRGELCDLYMALLDPDRPLPGSHASRRPFGPRYLTAVPELPPVMGKLYLESTLHERPC